jgi:hypothetical protein
MLTAEPGLDCSYLMEKLTVVIDADMQAKCLIRHIAESITATLGLIPASSLYG